jgi:streptomycin 6-kinase
MTTLRAASAPVPTDAEWALAPDDAPTHGECALVLPVRTDAGRAAALKVTWRHWEAETGHIALQRRHGDGAVELLRRHGDGAVELLRRHGDGAVELLRADPHRLALLLERLDPADLTRVPVDESCTVIAEFRRRLHVPAPPQLRSLSECVRDRTEWSSRRVAWRSPGCVGVRSNV